MGEAHIIAKHIICDSSQPRFVPQADDDVLASLEMRLTLGQMMLCLEAQMKKATLMGCFVLGRIDKKDADFV